MGLSTMVSHCTKLARHETQVVSRYRFQRTCTCFRNSAQVDSKVRYKAPLKQCEMRYNNEIVCAALLFQKRV